MSKEHFEPVTARSLASKIQDSYMPSEWLGLSYDEKVNHIEAIISPHIRKPSDDDKSVPARCEEAYNKAVKLIKEAVIIIDGKQGTGKWQEAVYELFIAENPFKEADIVEDDVDVLMDLMDKEKDAVQEPNLPSDVEMFKKRLRDIQYFKETDSDYVHTGKINALFDELILAVEYYKTHNVSEELKPEPRLLPFDLKAAQDGAKVVTRDGRSAKIVADNITGDYPILAVVTSLDGDTGYASFTIKGNRALSGRDTELDLFILKEPETVALRLYKDRNDGSIQAVNVQHDSMTKYYDADCDLIKTITVTI